MNVFPIFAPAVNVAPKTRRLSMAAMVERRHSETVRRQRGDETGVPARVLAQTMNYCDNSPQRSIWLPDLEIQLQSAGAMKSRLTMLYHGPNLVLQCSRAISLIAAKGEEKAKEERRRGEKQ
jgi:hypothetical protein